MGPQQAISWSCLTPADRTRIVRELVLGDGADLRAMAHAVRAYLQARYGWKLVEYEFGKAEFGDPCMGPAGFAEAATWEDAVCIAALRAVGHTVHST